MPNCSQPLCETLVYAADRHEPHAPGDAVFCSRHCTRADCAIPAHAGYRQDIAAARTAACVSTRSTITTANPAIQADWRCPTCARDFFGHPAGAAAVADGAGAAAIPGSVLEGLSSVLSRAVDAITAGRPSVGTDDDSRTGGKASDWGLDPTMYAAHPACWSSETIAKFVQAIKAESTAMAQIDDRIRLAAARRNGNMNVLGSDIIETIPITSHVSVRSLTHDARLCAATPSAEVRQIAALLSVQRCVTTASAGPRAGGAGQADGAADGDGVVAALSVPAASVRDGSTGDISATTLINRVALSLLDAAGRTRLCQLFEVIAKDHRNDAVHWVLVENGKYVIVPWVLHVAKVLIASHIMFLRRLDSDFEHPELPNILIPATRPRRTPWPLRLTPAPLNIIGDIVDLALVDCVGRSPKGSTILGITPVAIETGIRHWLSRIYTTFVTKGSNSDLWKSLPPDVLAAWHKSTTPGTTVPGTPRAAQPGSPGQRGGRGPGPGRGGGSNPPITPSPVAPSPAAGSPLGKRGGAAGAGAAAAGGAAGAGAGAASGGNPSKLRFTKCHWKGCPHTVPQDIIATRGGVTKPLCPTHQRDYAAMADADKARLRAEFAAAGIPLGD